MFRPIWNNVADCPKCGGAGWVWWNELDEYHGPANEGGADDTKYTCDHECHNDDERGEA